MIPSGPRSYYDEYMRKKGTQRLLSFPDPTSLLTDRGAYVNFLEVQLERVSAACLTAQSYEERFNDMQGMIKALEQRCAANVKLIALAQQCTEEVRAEADHKLNLVIKHQQDHQKQTDKSLHILTQQEQNLERAVSAIPLLDARILSIERNIIENDQKHEENYDRSLQTLQTVQKTVDELDSFSKDLSQRIHQNSKHIHETKYDITQFQQDVQQFQTTIQQQLNDQKQQFTQQLSVSEQSLKENILHLDSVIQKYQLENINLMKNQYSMFTSELENNQHSLQDEIRQCRSELSDAFTERAEQSQKMFDSKIEEVTIIQTEQLQNVHKLEEEMIQYFENTDNWKSLLEEKQQDIEVALQHAQDIHEKQVLFLHEQYQTLRREILQESENEIERNNSNASMQRLFPSLSRSKSMDRSLFGSSVSSVGATRGAGSSSQSGYYNSRTGSSKDSFLSSKGMIKRSTTLQDEDNQTLPTRKSAISALSSSSTLPSNTISEKKKRLKRRGNGSRKIASNTSLSDSDIPTRKSTLFSSSEKMSRQDLNLSSAGSKMSQLRSLKKIPSNVSFDLSMNEYLSPHLFNSTTRSKSKSTEQETKLPSSRRSIDVDESTIASKSEMSKPDDEESEVRRVSSEDVLRSIDEYSQQMAQQIRNQFQNKEGEEKSVISSIGKYEKDREEIFQRLDNMYKNVLRAAESVNKRIKPGSPKRIAALSRSPSPNYSRLPSASSTPGAEELQEYLRKNFPDSSLYQALDNSRRDISPAWKPTKSYQKPVGKSSIPSTYGMSLPLTTGLYKKADSTRNFENKATSTTSLASSTTTTNSNSDNPKFNDVKPSARFANQTGMESQASDWVVQTDAATISTSMSHESLFS